jgi:PAS domain S-box-containing protein/putative nucleotidyltransferase with HDIG domain
LLTELAGDLAYALEALRDETARRTAEAALQESESKFRNVFQNSRDPIVVSHAGLHVFENQAYLQVYGYETPGELADRPVLDLVAASHRDQIASYIRNRGAGQEAPGFYESRGLRKNGSEFDTEIQASTFELQGRVHILAIIRDITERKKNEERLRQGNRELREAFQSSIRALSSAIEMRDPYTAGHQERVTRLSVAIAREMGLDDDKVEGIRIAGMVHDIGKLSIPAEILSKPTKLQPIEYSMIQSHPLSGFTILENIPFPWPIARIVLQHHERMDGSGYPNKLAGEAILIEARIIAVADVVEAMSSHRPYRPALEPQEAMKEIRGGKGTVYDPAVVDACIRVISRPDFSFN